MGELLLSIGVFFDLFVERFNEIRRRNRFLNWFRKALEREGMRIFFKGFCDFWISSIPLRTKRFTCCFPCLYPVGSINWLEVFTHLITISYETRIKNIYTAVPFTKKFSPLGCLYSDSVSYARRTVWAILRDKLDTVCLVLCLRVHRFNGIDDAAESVRNEQKNLCCATLFYVLE